jgi:hypothetical protein
MRDFTSPPSEIDENMQFRITDYFKYGFELWKRHFWLITSYVAICLFLYSLAERYVFVLRFFRQTDEYFGYFSNLSFRYLIICIVSNIFAGGMYYRLAQVDIYEKSQHWLSDFLASDSKMLQFACFGLADFAIASLFTSLFNLFGENSNAYMKGDAFYIFNLLTSLFRIFWQIFTLFVLPLIAISDQKWLAAIKTSFQLVKKRIFWFLLFSMSISFLLGINSVLMYMLGVYNGRGDTLNEAMSFYKVFAYAFTACVIYMAFKHLIMREFPNEGDKIAETLEEKISQIGEQEIEE